MSGSAFCWGGNAIGTLGDGTASDRSEPAPVVDGHSFASLDAGAGHNCALTPAGAAWCWGQNDEGQLGDGTFSIRTRPVAVAGGLTFSSISAGHAHSCALTSAGDAWCWGDDSRGQLGDGGPAAPEKSNVPVRVQFDQPFASIYAGYYQTCAVTTQATAWCWGLGAAGQNGDGSLDDRHSPVAVAGGRAFTSLSPGDRFVCGVSGEVWCWGLNRHGELGSASPDTSPVPLSLPELPAMLAVFTSNGTSTVQTGEAYGCGIIASNSRVACWGGAVRSLRSRGDVLPLDDRIRTSLVAAGAQHICILGVDGYAYCGGANYSGQLGDGTRTDRGAMVPVIGPG